MLSKTLFLLSVAIIMSCLSIAQPTEDPEFRQMIKRLTEKKADSSHAELLFHLAEHYILRPGERKSDMDSARLLIRQGTVLSEKLAWQKGNCYSHLLLATATRESGDNEKAKALVTKAIELCKNNNQLRLLGQSYIELSQHYSPWDSVEYLKKSELYRYAHDAFKLSGNIEEQAFCLKNLADLDANINDDPAPALNMLHEALSLYRSIDYQKLHGVYDLLGFVYSNNSDYVSAVKYGQLAMQTAEQLGDSSQQLGTIYNRLGRSYLYLKDFPSAKSFFLKSWQLADKLKDVQFMYDVTPNLINACMRLKDYASAARYLDMLVKKYPFEKSQDVAGNRSTVNSYYVILYTKMKNWEKARQYCKMFIDNNAIRFSIIYNYYDLNRLATYFIETKQFQMAETCLQEFTKRALAVGAHYDIGISYPLWFRLDSSRGNYLAAISHLQKHKLHEDSIIAADKSKLMAVTRIEYETARKDQDLKIKTQSIDLLTKTNEVQKQKIEKSELMQNMTWAGIVLLAIVFTLLYNQYRIKKRNNKEISQKNLSLQRLVDEKELLLKEVHHRVKNNLHIVMSLLESQSAYLKNDALLAIQNSQNRVYAMSLIHQKLYQSEQVTNIDMAAYLPELIHHLRESFDLDRRIRLQTDIEPIRLDISQAIPIGLIINEAITNSIKYAFPGNRPGRIHIEMIRNDNNKISLSISDDGIGLPSGLDYANAPSLGMRLMKGLSEDIRAQFNIENNNGTAITIEFEEPVLFKMVYKEENEEKALYS